MPKLTDTQLVLLSNAATRENSSLIPPPDSLTATTDKVRKAIVSLIKAGLAEEGEVQDIAHSWRQDGEVHYGARITLAGKKMIDGDATTDGHCEAPPSKPINAAPSPKQTKAGLVLEMLQREGGATLAELVTATDWLPHTTRAALTGLRKKGHQIEKDKRGDVTCYRLGKA